MFSSLPPWTGWCCKLRPVSYTHLDVYKRQIHTLGHSVGIDVHDPYDYSKPFEIGSVFTIEPGIYIPEEKIGVRIEDTFYVNAAGKLIDFAEKLPHTAEEVEAAMSAR